MMSFYFYILWILMLYVRSVVMSEASEWRLIISMQICKSHSPCPFPQTTTLHFNMETESWIWQWQWHCKKKKPLQHKKTVIEKDRYEKKSKDCHWKTHQNTKKSQNNMKSFLRSVACFIFLWKFFRCTTCFSANTTFTTDDVSSLF